MEQEVRTPITPSEADNEPAISPAEYNKVVAGLKLVSIALTNVSASVDRTATLNAMGKGSVPLDIRARAGFEDGAAVKVVQSYRIGCRSGRHKCLAIDATYELLFNSSEPFTPEFFSAFQVIALPTYVWPYFRELAQSITSRMSLPPLVLPLVGLEVMPPTA